MKINDEGSSNAAHWHERAMKAEAWLAEAEREARVLVVAMADQCGAPDNWKPLPDAAGMITQISNMVAGLREERALLVTRAENAEAALVESDALLREMLAWKVAIECIAPELGGAIMTLARIDAHLARDEHG